MVTDAIELTVAYRYKNLKWTTVKPSLTKRTIRRNMMSSLKS
jgi:hypothetical protein